MAQSRIRHAAVLTAAALATTGAVGAASTTTAAPAEAAPVGLRIAQHNTDQDPARWNRVVTLAESGNWDAVTAQEACEDWVVALRAKHPGWTIAYHEQTSNADCPNGKGNVAIHPGNGSTFAAPFDVFGEDKNFGMACANFDRGGHRVHACSTHFTVYATDPTTVRERQAKRVKDWTAEWIGQGHAVVVAGDLNTSPNTAALDPIYKNPAASSNGNFNEATQLATGSTARTGDDTVTGRKIDYVFFSANHTPLSAGGTLNFDEPTPGAHKILKAKTTLH
ncbi:MAG: endonuclease/exonuclease/phosphatase family protein [Knoellia sp.]